MAKPSKEELLSCAQRGMTHLQVAEEYGVACRTVEKWISALGIGKEYKELKRAFLYPTQDKSGLCEKCHEPHDGNYGSGRFCGEQCARSFATLNLTEEQKSLRDQALQRGKITQNAAWDEWRKNEKINAIPSPRPAKRVSYEWSMEQRERASQRQKAIWTTSEYRAKMANRTTSDETRKKLSASAKKLMAEGKIFPWTTRGKGMRSYPETTWEQSLEDADINYEPEYLIRKRELDEGLAGHYFLDFLIVKNGVRVDLEIDGKQHLLADRKRSDAVRDELLTANGYIVYRIPWINPHHDNDAFQKQLSDFLDFYKSL